MWDKIKKWFKDSETIFLARLQVLIGGLLAALASLTELLNAVPQIQQYLTPKLIGFYVIGLGLLTELLRRRRDPEMK
jgi:hypothetical protein